MQGERRDIEEALPPRTPEDPGHPLDPDVEGEPGEEEPREPDIPQEPAPSE